MELGAWSMELGAWSMELGAWSLELGAGGWEQGGSCGWLAERVLENHAPQVNEAAGSRVFGEFSKRCGIRRNLRADVADVIGFPDGLCSWVLLVMQGAALGKTNLECRPGLATSASRLGGW
jgi:hypothetical protein